MAVRLQKEEGLGRSQWLRFSRPQAQQARLLLNDIQSNWPDKIQSPLYFGPPSESGKAKP